MLDQGVFGVDIVGLWHVQDLLDFGNERIFLTAMPKLEVTTVRHDCAFELTQRQGTHTSHNLRTLDRSGQTSVDCLGKHGMQIRLRHARGTKALEVGGIIDIRPSNMSNTHQRTQVDHGSCYASLAALERKARHVKVGSRIVALATVAQTGCQGREHNEEVELRIVEEVVEHLASLNLGLQDLDHLL
ncbi:hypothetical protein HG530_003988 [Fusarium avenaceum]|nr:hypothetical protein HG530_003988 [Fusarium avenaceum]